MSVCAVVRERVGVCVCVSVCAVVRGRVGLCARGHRPGPEQVEDLNQN